MSSSPLTDNDVHSPTAWKRDLVDAGWEEVRHTIWRAPDGGLYRGPYGAWCEMQRRKARKEINDVE